LKRNLDEGQGVQTEVFRQQHRTALFFIHRREGLAGVVAQQSDHDDIEGGGSGITLETQHCLLEFLGEIAELFPQFKGGWICGGVGHTLRGTTKIRAPKFAGGDMVSQAPNRRSAQISLEPMRGAALDAGVSARLIAPLPLMTLMQALDRHAREKPAAVAFRFIKAPDLSTTDLTYAALRERALRIAQALNLRYATGNRVLLVLPPGADYIAAFIGCLYAGAIPVPTYPPRPRRAPERFLAVAQDAMARFVIGTAAVRRQIEATMDAPPEVAARLVWLTPEGEVGAPTDWALPYVDASTPAFLQYTSGSTAEPKGVVVTHGSLEHNLTIYHERCLRSPDEVLGFSWLPPFHDLGLIANLLGAVRHGVPEVIMSPQQFMRDPLSWLQGISHFRATVSAAPNFAFELCAARAEFNPGKLEGLDLSCWTSAFNGAEPIRPETLERFARTFAPFGFDPAAMSPGYGLAEATLVVSAQHRGRRPLIACFDQDALREGRVVPIQPGADAVRLVGTGEVLDGQEVAVVDPQTRRVCPADQVGEIWVRGNSVARGYWGHREATHETFGARILPDGTGPFLRTGDLGFLWCKQVFITGRRKDLIIIGGQNHYPQDIELTAQRAHPALGESMGAAFAVEGEAGEALAVVHEINLAHLEAPFAEVAGALNAAISEEHQLTVAHCGLVRFGSLPRTSSGKIRRRRCRDLFVAGELDSYLIEGAGERRVPLAREDEVADALPKAEMDRLRVGVAQVLGLDPVAIEVSRPLLEQGMSSLRAAELQCLLDEQFGVKLDYEDFFEPWTVRRIAELIAEKRSSGGS
jgi:acyl-CoA synthetase (AMP-forming)/AMP-acid ligase II/acyl carrier protein